MFASGFAHSLRCCAIIAATSFERSHRTTPGARALTSSRLLPRAIAAIEARGLLLVYPVQNREDPPSLWSALHPRAPMRWAWGGDADARVVELWHLRERLARSRRVVYGKWLGGRAMFTSTPVFGEMLARVRAAVGRDVRRGLSREAVRLLEILEDDSPLATRSLRGAAEMGGRALEPTFVGAMRELWGRLLIVGAGEEAEGGFPSLAVGATSLLFEDVWEAASAPTAGDDALFEATFARSPSFARSFGKALRAFEARAAEVEIDASPAWKGREI
jgi:hypothetical protein